MKIGKLSDTKRGWVIGDFEPSLLRTKDFEVGVLFHPKGEKWPAHYHKIAREYNILVLGTMSINGYELEPGDTFVIEQNEIADPIFHTDCTIVCIKVPSNTTDKYVV